VRAVAAEIARELDLATLLRLIVERARDLVESDAGTILLWSEAEQALVPQAWVGVGDWVGGARVTLDQGVSGRVFTTGQGKIVNEYQSSALALPRMIERGHITAVVAAPLVYRGTRLGAMVVNHVQAGRTFSPRDLATLELFAGQAAIAIENARLYTETIRRQRQAEALATLANTLTESLALGPVGDRLVKSVTALLGTPGASVRLLQPDGALLTLASVGPAGPLLPPGQAFAPGEALAGRAAALGVPCWTSDILADLEVSLTPAVRERIAALGLRAVLVVPVRAKGAVIGTLTASDRTGRRFTPGEVEFLQTIADQAALAIENARLHEETQRRRHDAETSEARYRSLVDGSIQGMIIVRDGRILFANPSLASMFGYDSPGEVIGQPTMVLVAPHEQARILDYARRREANEAAPSRYEFEGVQRGGTPIWLEVLVSPTRWEGEPATQVTLIDFTERKRTAEALHQKEEQLRQSQKMEAIGQLAGGVAHDFNNLLTVIGGRLEILLGGLADDDPMARDLTLVQRAADRAAGLTRQLLAFSRKQMLQPRIVDLNGVMAGMDGMLHRLIGEHIELLTQPGRDLWRVHADPGQIEQVILNLAVNARDAMPEGGRLTIRTTNMLLTSSDLVEMRDLAAGAYVLLAVSDTGTGMDDATQARAFEPFFTTKGPGRGTGLGLSTVYGIVKQSGGDIVVRSAPRRGTTFEIYLPRVTGVVVADETPRAPVSVGRGNETILVTEDDAGVRALVCDILRGQGYRVLAADGPDEAISVCEAHTDPIHLLLTDVVMPRMNGRMLADRLRERRPKLRVAFMSGYTDTVLASRGALEYGVTLIQKPFTPGSLAHRVREVLEATSSR
jgi:PAS domain S-box-containing protein